MLNVTRLLFSAVEGALMVLCCFSSFIPPNDQSQKLKWSLLTLIALVAAGTQMVIVKPIALVITILVFAIAVWCLLRRATPAVIINIMLVSMVLQLVSLISIVLVQIIFSTLHVGRATTAINIVRVIPWAVLVKLVTSQAKKLDLTHFCERYALAIEAAFFVLFFISYSLIKIPTGTDSRLFRFLAVVVLGILLFVLAMWYLLERERQSKERAQKERIAQLIEETHRYKESVPAVERALQKMQMQLSRNDVELAQEIDASLSAVTSMRKDMEKEATRQICTATTFKSTGLTLLDCQLEDEQSRAADKGILFYCEVFSRADDAIRQIGMPEHLLMQIIGDLYRNAVKAIEDRHCEPRQILLTMGDRSDGYLIQMSDTGIPFARARLFSLGDRALTPGEHGHGYPDICQVLYQHGASLEIDQPELGTDIYVKTVSIAFDGLKELRITMESREVEIIDLVIRC